MVIIFQPNFCFLLLSYLCIPPQLHRPILIVEGLSVKTKINTGYFRKAKSTSGIITRATVTLASRYNWQQPPVAKICKFLQPNSEIARTQLKREQIGDIFNLVFSPLFLTGMFNPLKCFLVDVQSTIESPISVKVRHQLSQTNTPFAYNKNNLYDSLS